MKIGVSDVKPASYCFGYNAVLFEVGGIITSNLIIIT